MTFPVRVPPFSPFSLTFFFFHVTRVWRLRYMAAFVGFLGLSNGQHADAIRGVAPAWMGLGSPGAAAPLCTLSGFLGVWGWVFVGTTVAVAVLKREEPAADDDAVTGVTAGANTPADEEAGTARANGDVGA